PTEELLDSFAQGKLPAGMSVAISAHVELCNSCKEKTSIAEVTASDAWLKTLETKAGDEFAHLISDIVKQPQQKNIVVELSSVNEIHMLDHSVKLPKPLAKVASEGLVWKKYTGGINRTEFTLDDETQCEFVYMKPGSRVPMHKHQGNEVTLVIDGSFSDELGHYKSSDFVVRNKEHTHQPASEEGCLCFAVLDSPLTFTRGIVRLLNPINRYKFRRVTGPRAE
ncbi:uncharacterized protein METZ01_LOCUS444259, partial [marine metagenome]